MVFLAIDEYLHLFIDLKKFNYFSNFLFYKYFKGFIKGSI
jgi:hypothetical protein